MAIWIDPSGEETRALEAATEWQGKKVIEIGCGDGRLTQRLASLNPSMIEALDADKALVRSARINLPAEYVQKVKFQVGQAESLKFKPGTFDTALFSWSL